MIELRLMKWSSTGWEKRGGQLGREGPGVARERWNRMKRNDGGSKPGMATAEQLRWALPLECFVKTRLLCCC